MKKTLVLAAAMLLTFMLVYGQSVAENQTINQAGDFRYTILNNGDAEIIRYLGSSSSLSIPDTLDGHPVTIIGKKAFRDCISLTDISIPRSVTRIDDMAFIGCVNLHSATIPDSVYNISGSAFDECHVGLIVGRFSYAREFAINLNMPYRMADDEVLPTSDNSTQVSEASSENDILTFGHYEQDNDLSNGMEPIQWRVLAHHGSKALLVSLYVLDVQHYFNKQTTISWETCALRDWLNNDFFHTAFTPVQQNAIVMATIINDNIDEYRSNDARSKLMTISINNNNDEYNSNVGSLTHDKVFILNENEIGKYNVESGAKFSTYANPLQMNMNSYYWRRSLGEIPFDADSVYSIMIMGGGVRPALYLDLSKLNANDVIYGDNWQFEYTSENVNNESQLQHPTHYIDDIVNYGTYEQDNNLQNGSEPIQWQILALKGSKALLVSTYNLDFQPYNTTLASVTWQTCTLRKWLNSNFINVAFTSGEQKAIITETLQNDENSEYGTPGGEATQDRIFLLSEIEAKKLFGFNGDRDRIAKNSAYVKAQGAHTSDINAGWWWLRSPGRFWHYVTYVNTDGSIELSGYRIYGIDDLEKGAVRPAIWLDLSSL